MTICRSPTGSNHSAAISRSNRRPSGTMRKKTPLTANLPNALQDFIGLKASCSPVENRPRTPWVFGWRSPRQTGSSTSRLFISPLTKNSNCAASKRNLRFCLPRTSVLVWRQHHEQFGRTWKKEGKQNYEQTDSTHPLYVRRKGQHRAGALHAGSCSGHGIRFLRHRQGVDRDV